MPSESSFELPQEKLMNGLEMDVKNEDFLDDFNDLDMFLTDDTSDDYLLQSRLNYSNPFFDSIFQNDAIGDVAWPDSLGETNDAVEIKSEPSSRGDSPRSHSSLDSNFSDQKFELETPPVSPPVLDQPKNLQPQAQDIPRIQIVQQSGIFPVPKKATILTIDKNNIKIIKASKGGFKLVGKQPSILPKEVQNVNCVNAKLLSSERSLLIPEKTAPHPITPKPVVIASNATVNLTVPDIRNARIASSPSVASNISKECDQPQLNDFKLKALKRQQRMIRNRESACLSRKKKKEHVTQLESTVTSLEEENSRLRVENYGLKARIKEMESNCCCGESSRKRPYLNTNLRKTTAVLAVVFMVSINIGSLGIISRDVRHTSELNANPSPGSGSRPRVGRSLLWVTPENINTTRASMQGPMCPLRINQTESIRLEKELRRWIAVGEKRGRYSNASAAFRPKPSLRQLILDNNIPLNRPFKAQKLRNSVSALDFYKAPFPGALPRRDDTFYVFSFSSDHLLVPAVAHNNTLRPKMSFIIPAVPLNDTVIKNGSVPMMQIDCEVLATRSIQFTEKDFKLFKPQEETRAKNINQTAQVKMDTGSSYKPYFIHRRRFRPSQEYYDSFELNANKLYRAPRAEFP
ncbi:activating transcription factor 6 [Nesidiocoris tenuis]|uniref:Activating transcription factor 6 n=1 Tax=Nesidiocoris tenuis TaxID=355587 RepID=A0ABN7B7K6_9HEMI|nr:activating transcription factor 6 [Nesidiocoris tenuis]